MEIDSVEIYSESSFFSHEIELRQFQMQAVLSLIYDFHFYDWNKGHWSGWKITYTRINR